MSNEVTAIERGEGVDPVPGATVTLPKATNLVDTPIGPDIPMQGDESITHIGQFNSDNIYRVTRGETYIEPVPEVLLQAALDKLREWGK